MARLFVMTRRDLWEVHTYSFARSRLIFKSLIPTEYSPWPIPNTAMLLLISTISIFRYLSVSNIFLLGASIPAMISLATPTLPEAK